MKNLLRLLLFSATALLVISLIVWISKPTIDTAIPEHIPAAGRTAKLTVGTTYYETAGPDYGEIVLMIHGSFVPNIVYDNTFAALADSGLRTIRYDLYGRGFSSRPRVDYTPELYIEQIGELLDHLRVTEPVHLMGLSMGGALAMLFNHQHPKRVRSLILIDPVTPTFFSDNQQQRINRLKERLGRLLSSDTEQASHIERVRPLMQKAREQLRYKGVPPAVFSAARHFQSMDLESAYWTAGNSALPVLLIWGQEDEVIPISESATVLELIPQTQFHAIEGAGHMPHYEEADIVNGIFYGFLRSQR